MFSPARVQCGISDYTKLLVEGLREQAEISEVRIVDCYSDRDVNAAGYIAKIRRYQQMARDMNWPEVPEQEAVAHIQHQYFHFGGVAPYKTHIRIFLASLKMPCVMTVHEIVDEPIGASLRVRMGIRMANRMNFLHPAVSQFIVHTRADRDRLAKIGVSVSRISVIVHGIPPAQELPDATESKQKLQVEGRRVVTLFGFLSRKKGHHLAIEAISQVPNDVVLLLAGGQHPDDHSSYTAELQRDIETRGLTDRVRITGYLPGHDLPVVMAATDVAIAPYQQTSGSGSIANLLAYGRPVIASDIDPHREICEDLPASLILFETGSSQMLAQKIEMLLGDNTYREQLSQAALSYAKRHSYWSMARDFVPIYRKALL